MTTIVVLIILGLSAISVPAQDTEITFPEFQIEEYTYQSNDRNDFYIEADPYHQLINHDLSFNSTSMDHNNFDGTSYSNVNDPVNEGVTFNSDNSGIMEFLNNTALNQELLYERNYYNLFDNETTTIGKIALTNSIPYLFTFTVSDPQPMFLSFLFSTASGALDFSMDIVVVTPEGFSDSIPIAVTKGIEQSVPFYPRVAGVYYFALTPDTNVVLDNIDYTVTPEMETVRNGFTDHLMSDAPISKYLRFETNDQFQYWDLNSIVYQQEYYVNDFTTVQLGTLNLHLFSPSSVSVFGSQTIDTYVATADDYYMALIANPSSTDDPAIRKAKQEEGIDFNMDIELILTTQRYDIDPLPRNSDFTSNVELPYSADTSTKLYSFNIASTYVVGVNSTTTGLPISFQSNDPDLVLTNYQVDPDLNDILNSNIDDAVILPTGNYYVTVPINQDYRVSTYTLESFNIGSEKIFTSTLDQNKFYSLPSNEYTSEYMNVTYLDETNDTVDYEFTYYDFDGNRLETDALNFEHYYDNTTADYIVANQSASTRTGRNINGIYLRIVIVGNSHYDLQGNLDYSDVTNITSQISITRLNNYRVLAEINQPDLYLFGNLNSGPVNSDFYVLNNTVRGYVDFTTQENSVYRITIDTSNRTIPNFFLYATNTIQWISDSQATATNVSNIDHYILQVDFATTEAMHMAFFFQLDNTNFNGSLAIGWEEISLLQLPGPLFPSLNNIETTIDDDTTGDGEDEGDVGDSILSNPLLYAGIAGGLAIIGAIVYLRGRPKTP